jgi:hypothetical protein
MMTVLLAMSPLVTRADVELVRDGRSDYRISVSDTPEDKAAARELQDYLSQVTGAKLPIDVQANPNAAAGLKIVVGNQDLKGVGPDGIQIKTVGTTLYLTGTAPRGAMNAVHSFLEDQVGVRWWTSSESVVPKKPTLTVPPLDISYTPKFRYREVFNCDSISGGDRATFANRLKLNGHHNGIPPELGGHYSILGFVHTTGRLLPPDRYFAKHPDWYALLNGKRQPNTQLCLTNKAMQAELIEQAMKRVRKEPDAGIISISQNDCLGPCQCDDCRAVLKEDGSESGAWIRLCNLVAAEINTEYPNFLVETLAYQYTRKPPKLSRPSKNVLVRLCSIECDFSKPLAGESNKSFGDDLRGWRAIAPNLFIWNYVTNFSNYLIPHPNLDALGADLRFFADNNVVGVFEQGDCFNDKVGDFLPMRTWVLARLLWDPSRDQQKLQQEFLNGYYGPAAAPHLAKYLKIVNGPAERPTFRIGCYNKEPKLNDRRLADALACFDAAEKAVAVDETLLKRVRRERLAIEHVALMKQTITPEAKEEYRAKVDAWAAAAKQAGVKNFSEQQLFEPYVPALRARADKP